MREIKFRGRVSQCLENAGQWVYWGINGTDMIDAIDPDTIGQYIGIKSKAGKEIYEGDIIRYTLTHGVLFGVIAWDEIRVRFALNEDGVTPWGINNRDTEECAEVIGTFYENPELLENNNG